MELSRGEDGICSRGAGQLVVTEPVKNIIMPIVDPTFRREDRRAGGRAFGRDGRDEDIRAEEKFAAVVLSFRIAGIGERQRAADREAGVGGFTGGGVDIGEQRSAA